METLFDNQGLIHIGLKILQSLDSTSLADCRLVNHNWCEVITRERFWTLARIDLLEIRTKLNGPKEIVQEK